MEDIFRLIMRIEGKQYVIHYLKQRSSNEYRKEKIKYTKLGGGFLTFLKAFLNIFSRQVRQALSYNKRDSLVI